MVFALIGLPVRRFLRVKAAKFLLGHIRYGDQAVKLLQKRGLAQRRKSGERSGPDGFGGKPCRPRGIFVVLGMPVGVGEYGSELLFLQTVKLCGGLFFILLQRRQFLQYFDRIQKGPPYPIENV